jgi:hypothetical protein
VGSSGFESSDPQILESSNPRTRHFASGRSLRTEIARYVFVFVLFGALTAVLTYPQVRHLSTGVNDAGDPLLNAWALAWIAHQLPQEPAHVFDANIFYPERRTLAYSETLLVPGLMTAPLIWSGAGPILAYNLLFLSGFVLSGVGTFLLVRTLTGRSDAAIVSGVLFAFQPFRIDHYAHLQMQLTQFMPLGLWALHRTLAGGRIRDGLLTGLFVACNALSCMYYGVFFGAYIAVLGLALVVGIKGRALRRATPALVAGAVLALAILIPLSRPYFQNRQQLGDRSREVVQIGSAEPRNYLGVSANNWLYAEWRAFGKDEARLFPGLLIVALAIVGLWPPFSRVRIAYLIATVFAFDASLGFNGFVYRVLYEVVLPFRGLRVPARMGILVGLSLSVLAGYGVARLSDALRGRAVRIALPVVLIATAVVEYRSVPLRMYDVPAIPPVYDWLALQPPSVVLELPLDGPDSKDPTYMYFATRHWQPLVNGYSGFFPNSYIEAVDDADHFPDDIAIRHFQRRGVDYVIVHERYYDPDVYREMIRRIDARADLEAVSRSVWEGKELRLYRLRRPL